MKVQSAFMKFIKYKKIYMKGGKYMDKEKKLGLPLLIALGIGSMIGGGIFNSPTDLIGKANPQAVIIAWIIGGIGIIFLALVFQLLAIKDPNSQVEYSHMLRKDLVILPDSIQHGVTGLVHGLEMLHSLF